MKRSILLLSLLGTVILQAQESTSQDTITSIGLEGVSLIEKLPITVEKITKEKLQQKNLGQDVPALLNNATSVLTSSDTGNGIGYSTLRIRGLSESQINVTMNGISLNNGESQGVFWVNMPDLASSINSMTIQRGVGSSSNGMAAFGASVNIETQKPSLKPFAEIATSWGSFNAQKYTVQAGTGKILNNKLSIDGRFSKIDSKGYVERADNDLLSYDVTALYEVNENTSFRFQNMFGREVTYQAWNGVTKAQMEKNRKFNSAGAIYNKDWTEVIGYYDNEVDNYRQNHYYLTWNQNYGSDWKSNLTLHYTRGKGFYENYKQDAKLSKYNLTDLPISKTDLVRKKYLDNHFYGFNFELENRHLGDFEVYFGASANQYDGDHYGHIQWMKDFDWTDTSFKFYNNNALKTQASAYVKGLYKVGDFELYGDLQYRFVDYKTKYNANGENISEEFRPFEDQFNFFNPKAGINYKLASNQTIYAAYGISQREPLRKDYEGAKQKPKSEFLQDIELGYKLVGPLQLSANAYYMAYKDQLVLTGAMNDVGAYRRENAGKSYRTGIELDASYAIIPNYLNVFGNLNWSKNINKDYLLFDANDAPYKKDTKTSFSPEIISSFGFEVKPVQSLAINLMNKYVGEQYLANNEPADGKLDSYFVSDLLIRYTPNWFNLKKLELSLLINNIFDQEYVSYGSYYGEPSYFPQAGINVLGGVRIRL